MLSLDGFCSLLLFLNFTLKKEPAIYTVLVIFSPAIYIYIYIFFFNSQCCHFLKNNLVYLILAVLCFSAARACFLVVASRGRSPVAVLVSSWQWPLAVEPGFQRARASAVTAPGL